MRIADDSHETSCLICYFGKSNKILNCRLLQNIGGALWVKLFYGDRDSVGYDRLI